MTFVLLEIPMLGKLKPSMDDTDNWNMQPGQWNLENLDFWTRSDVLHVLICYSPVIKRGWLENSCNTIWKSWGNIGKIWEIHCKWRLIAGPGKSSAKGWIFHCHVWLTEGHLRLWTCPRLTCRNAGDRVKQHRSIPIVFHGKPSEQVWLPLVVNNQIHKRDGIRPKKWRKSSYVGHFPIIDSVWSL